MRICASIIGREIPDFVSLASRAGTHLLEVRADGLKKCDAPSVTRLLKEVRKVASAGADIILTVRKAGEGGKFQGSEAERIDILRSCMRGADFVDIELSTAKRQREELIRRARAKGIGVIISAHDFKGTPSREEMLAILRGELDAGATIAKLAVKANSKGDVLRLLDTTSEAAEMGRICTIAMGNAGRIGRMVAPFFGSEIAYAAVSEDEGTAPGQLTVEEMKRLLEILG